MKDKESETAEKIIQLLGEEPDATVDACGAESTIRLAILVSLLLFVHTRIFSFLSTDFSIRITIDIIN